MRVRNEMKYATLRKQYPEKQGDQVLTPKMSCPKDILQIRMGEVGPNWMERNAMDKKRMRHPRVKKTWHLSIQPNHSIKRKSACINQQ